MHVLHRYPARVPELGIHLSDEVLDLFAKLAILGNLFTTRHDHLNHLKTSQPGTIGTEQSAESEEALNDSLGVVETVYADDEATVRELLPDLVSAIGDRFFRRASCKVFEVDANGVGTDDGVGSIGLDDNTPVRLLHVGFRYEAANASQEVTAIAFSLETDTVEAQQSAGDFDAPGQLFEYVWLWERD